VKRWSLLILVVKDFVVDVVVVVGAVDAVAASTTAGAAGVVRAGAVAEIGVAAVR
jgi:hypothetical protein